MFKKSHGTTNPLPHWVWVKVRCRTYLCDVGASTVHHQHHFLGHAGQEVSASPSQRHTRALAHYLYIERGPPNTPPPTHKLYLLQCQHHLPCCVLAFLVHLVISQWAFWMKTCKDLIVTVSWFRMDNLYLFLEKVKVQIINISHPEGNGYNSVGVFV